MIDYSSTSTLRSAAPGTFKGTPALREQPWGLSDPSDPTFQNLLGMKRLMQLPGHARVRRRPSHHLSLPRRPWHRLFLQDPRTPTFSSVPYAPRTACPPRGSPSLASDVLFAFPGALAGHAPVSLRWNPRTRDQERAPSLSQTPRKLLRSAAPDFDLLGLSGSRGRPAQHQRPLRVGPACAPSGPPEPHTRVTTTFKGAALQGAP